MKNKKFIKSQIIWASKDKKQCRSIGVVYLLHEI
ncbi:hypothetical protein SAMN05216293_3659 [Flagellimonas taeanensis]|uniref:Uncharacterized protein n=1 Tax=Flagellimonas taeanensis TaxID=1005926 RepID=A0A1M7BD10_9FLAO|nr:hypothetical protein SAMN05216293_3659 [Allomuricauda taeanensis]